MVGLAVLGLLAEAAAERPLVCLVDDAQWLDEPSRQVLGFVGRRLLAEAVLLLFAVREDGDEQLLPALPSLTLEGLAAEDARALLAAAVSGQLDEQVRDRIVAETRGNPLAVAGAAPGDEPGRAGRRLRRSPRGRVVAGRWRSTTRGASERCRRRRSSCLLLAAADPTGDATLLWRAAQALGITRSAAAAAESEQLLEIGTNVRFRHPLVRSAAYAAGSAEDRRAAHAALAEATDARVDPERRVWHLAAAATGPGRGRRVAARRDGGGGSGARRPGGGGGVPRAFGRS